MQRGNARQYILASDADRTVYLSLSREYAAHHELSVMDYCLMSNHIHLIVIPHRPDALALALKHTHGRSQRKLSAHQIRFDIRAVIQMCERSPL